MSRQQMEQEHRGRENPPRLSLMTSCLLALAIIAVPAIVNASEPTATGKSGDEASSNATPAEIARQELLDNLHSALAKSASEQEARRYSQQIWAVWLSHPKPTINKLMQDALAARQRSNFDFAISLLDTIIEREPAYAEAWNQRATIYFMVGKYEDSLKDVAETLKREPRHFGALSGRGMIRLRQGQDALAWQNFEEARKIHPYIGGRHLIPKSVRETDT
ncbi:MAG: tetratricopeptide repeat protein [Burkholderiaceae bacterium]